MNINLNSKCSMEKFSREDLHENYNVRKLQLGETIESFDCGDTDLNDFIINEAHHYRKALLAVTYVMEHRKTGEIVGYFSLANDRVSITDFENIRSLTVFVGVVLLMKNVYAAIRRLNFVVSVWH